GEADGREAYACFAGALAGLMTELRDGHLGRDAEPLIRALRDREPPERFATALARLAARRGRTQPRPQAIFPYGTDAEGRERGVILLAPRGVTGLPDGTEREGGTPSTEDDLLGSTPGFRQTLDEHSDEVRRCAETFTAALGLAPALAGDVALAAYLHDWGKRDRRFQALLHGGDWFAVDER